MEENPIEPLFLENMSHFNKGPTKLKRYTERIQIVVLPKMMASVDKIIGKGYFFNRSEFIRYLISSFLEDNEEKLQ